jgi:hypothetical protein
LFWNRGEEEEEKVDQRMKKKNLLSLRQESDRA